MRRERKTTNFVTLERPDSIENIKKDMLDEYKEAFTEAKRETEELYGKDLENEINSLEKQKVLLENFKYWGKQIPEHLRINNFSTGFSNALTRREPVIASKLEELTDHMMDKNKQELHQHNFVQFRVGGKEDGKYKIKSKLTKSTTPYTFEKDLEKIGKKRDKDFVPQFQDNENTEIIEAKNIVLLSEKQNIKIPKHEFDPLNYRILESLLSQSEYVLTARVKKSEREKQKDTDYVTGIRDDLPHDSIGLMIITPKEKLMRTIYDTFDVLDPKGRCGVGDIDTENFTDLIGVTKGNKNINYNEHMTNKIIGGWWELVSKRNDEIIKSLEKEAVNGKTRYSKIVTGEDRDNLLRFLKIYLTLGGYKTEIILNTKNETAKTYFGSLGHHGSYYEFRKKDRLEKHKENKTDKIMSDIDNMFSHLYFKD